MSKNDVAKIKSTVRKYCAAANAGDPDAWEKTLDGKAVWLPPDAPRLVGSKAVMGFTRARFFEPYKIKLGVKLNKVQVFGSKAFAPASFYLDLTPKAGGDTIKMTGKAVHEFRKQRDGSWKYGELIWNYDKPSA
jgi:ketosteroid isomerase-like protein